MLTFVYIYNNLERLNTQMLIVGYIHTTFEMLERPDVYFCLYIYIYIRHFGKGLNTQMLIFDVYRQN